MPTRLRAVSCAVLAALAVAPAAHAATINAKPGAGTLQTAIGQAAAGDTIVLAAGDYTGAATVDKANLTIDGSAGARLLGPVAVQASGAVLRTVTLAPEAAGLTIGENGGATLDKVLGARTAGGDVPVVSSAGTLAIADSTIASTTGSVLAVTGKATSLARTTVIATPSSADAVVISNSLPGDRGLTVSSSLLRGGAAGGAGVRASTAGLSAAPVNLVGNVNVALRHVTIAGAAAGVALASGTSGTGGGAIAATATGSIVHPASSATSSTTGGGPASYAADPTTDGPGGGQNTPDATLFAANYRLRADSPAIGKGGPLVSGESAIDLAGLARPATGTDMGAFQFSNTAPTTGLTLSAGIVDEGATVTAVLTPTDADAGDAIGAYAFNWGDGGQSIEKVPTATHTYAKPGVYTVKGAVTDARNTPSAVVEATVTVRDKRAPVIAITSPKAGQKLKYKRSRRLTITGTDTDATGVAKVEVALTRKQGKRCFQYGTTFKAGKCSKLTYKRATLKGTTWSLRTRKRVPLRRGTYTLRIRSVDGVANATAKPTKKNGLLRRFTVK